MAPLEDDDPIPSTNRGTRVYYNGITLVNVLTKRFDHTVRYDASDTDKEMDVFVVRVTGHVHTNPSTRSPVGVFRIKENKSETEEFLDPMHDQQKPQYNPAFYPNTAVANELTIRQLLTTPRREFRMRIGADTILWAFPWIGDGKPGDVSQKHDGSGKKPPPPGDLSVGGAAVTNPARVPYMPRDVNNGPKPRSVTVTRIIGTQLLEVEFEIEICMVECDALLAYTENRNRSGILSNRWTVRESMDSNFYTTRTIAGRLKCASNFLDPIRGMRGIIMPKLQDGFRRESVELTQSADGTIVDYQITDREFWMAAPLPCTYWEGRHTRTTGPGGATMSEHISFRLEGDKFARKGEMILLAGRIVDQKFGLAAAEAAGTNIMLQQLDIIDHLSENVIEVSMEVTTTPADIQVAAIMAISDSNNYLRPLGPSLMEEDPDPSKAPGTSKLRPYNSNRAKLPDLFGTASPMETLRCYLQNPCQHVHSVASATEAAPPPSNGGQPNSAQDTKPQADTSRTTGVKTGTYPKNATPAKAPGTVNADGKKAVYTYYEMNVTQTDDYNVVQLPIAAAIAGRKIDLPTSLVVRMAPPTTTRVVHVIAKRAGKWPRIPSPSSFRLNSGQLFFPMGKVSVRGRTPTYDASRKTKIYEVEMSIPYAITRPTLPGEYIIMGSLPWDNSSVLDNGLKPADTMVGGLVDSLPKNSGA